MGPRIYRVAEIGKGFLGIMAKPTAGDDAAAAFAEIAAAGIMQVASLLEEAEAQRLGLGQEAALCQAHQMRFAAFPIPDFGLPGSLEGFAAFTSDLCCDIAKGINTAVHCRGGIGRSGLTAAGVLLHAGLEPEDAFRMISEARGARVPETQQQHDWLINNRHRIQAWKRVSPNTESLDVPDR